MDKFIDLLRTFSVLEVVTLIVFILLGLKGASAFIKGVKANLEDWYQKKRGIEKKEETLENRVTKLEENDEKQMEKLDQIENSVHELIVFMQGAIEDRNKRLDELSDSHKQAVVAQARASLYRIAKELEGHDHITPTEYETFSELASIYIANGGNSIFRNKIIPTIESLPIRNE